MASNHQAVSSQQNKRRAEKDEPWIVSGGYFDFQTLFLTIIIVLIGLMMVYSASSYKAVLYTGDSAYFVKKQAGFALFGLFVVYAVSRVNYKKYKIFSKVMMVGAIALCGIVFILGISTNGATRWIPIGSFQFQPSEVAKIAIIIYMSHVCVVQLKNLETLGGIFRMCLLPIICIGLIAIENLSTAIVCAGVMIVILFVSSPNFLNIVAFALICVVGAAVMLFATGYRTDRIDAWLHPETSEHGFQTMQSLYAIGSGGLFGRGLGQSIQKMGFLPESHNDMIFSVICEELGLFGALGIMILFVMLLMRMWFIAKHTEDSFGGFIVTGVMTHIAVQLIINIGVVTNTIPPTGVTLPLISYGGTSLVTMLIEIGLVLSVSRRIKPINAS